MVTLFIGLMMEEFTYKKYNKILNNFFTVRFLLTIAVCHGLLHTMMKDGELYVECGCHTHALHFDRDSDPTVTVWYVSFWQRGYASTAGWLWRLRYIWQIIKTGRPYGDEVVLDRRQMEELSNYINNELNNT